MNIINYGDLKESALMAIDTIRANKIRSGLTILGVSVGVITVMFMVSIIQGLNRSFATQLEGIGSNLVYAMKFDSSFGRIPTQEERTREDLTMEEAEALRKEMTSIRGVSPIQRTLSETVLYKDKQTDTPLLFGTTPYYEEVHSQYIGRGRFITDLDLRYRTNVAVIGKDVEDALFPSEEAIGKDIKIGGRPFHVVGVMGDLGSIFGISRDNSVFIPLTTFQKYWRDIPYPIMVFAIIVRPIDRSQVGLATEEMREILRRQRRVKFGEPDSFYITSQDALLEIYNQLTGATYLVLTAISAVALMIGGIGVMNIMLVSVTERTAEIGIRKAVGATRKNIMSQFLIEATVLTGIGGIIGLITGEVISLLMNRYSPLPAYVPWWAIVIGLGVSGLVGIVFGLYPAWKAARLNPIEALSFE
ncbi:MAG: FtsX-like permease family protein [Pyrinomonadaceae bacterium]|nr:FtsX-like permease family protein [Pyrinomonadaceae bacterium]